MTRDKDQLPAKADETPDVSVVRHEDMGYEVSDISIGGVLAFGLVLVAAAAGIHLALFGMLKWLAQDSGLRVHMTGRAGFELREPLPPPPRILGLPGPEGEDSVDAARLREAEEAALRSYGWIDRGAGVAHIPIDRAMQILVERGLPARAPGEGAP